MFAREIVIEQENYENVGVRDICLQDARLIVKRIVDKQYGSQGSYERVKAENEQILRSVANVVLIVKRGPPT